MSKSTHTVQPRDTLTAINISSHFHKQNGRKKDNNNQNITLFQNKFLNYFVRKCSTKKNSEKISLSLIYFARYLQQAMVVVVVVVVVVVTAR